VVRTTDPRAKRAASRRSCRSAAWCLSCSASLNQAPVVHSSATAAGAGLVSTPANASPSAHNAA
jgi:hypothetical protein